MLTREPQDNEKLALSMIVPDSQVKKIKDALRHNNKEPVRIPIRLLVEVAGEIVKSADEIKPVPVAFDWKKAFLYLFSKVNGTMQASALRKALDECVKGAESISDEMESEIKPIADAAAVACVAATTTVTSGKTSWRGDVRIVADASNADAAIAAAVKV